MFPCNPPCLRTWTFTARLLRLTSSFNRSFFFFFFSLKKLRPIFSYRYDAPSTRSSCFPFLSRLLPSLHLSSVQVHSKLTQSCVCVFGDGFSPPFPISIFFFFFSPPSHSSLFFSRFPSRCPPVRLYVTFLGSDRFLLLPLAFFSLPVKGALKIHSSFFPLLAFRFLSGGSQVPQLPIPPIPSLAASLSPYLIPVSVSVSPLTFKSLFLTCPHHLNPPSVKVFTFPPVDPLLSNLSLTF